jgi:serine/threonine protein kinase
MRFLDEAQSMAMFSSHRSIVNVIEYFEENSTAYIVMEYLAGITLKEFLENNLKDVESSIEIISHVCSALKAIHKAGIIHRDVSPDNIFLCNNGDIRLLDFGAARFSSDEEQQRTVILKPGFAPPEQYEKVNIQGPWTDIYALGATFYYMLTGIKPDESVNRKIEDTLRAPHELDDTIPEYISNAIMQAMAVDKHIRFASISNFEKVINKEKKVLPVKEQIRKRKRNRLIEIVVALLVVTSSASWFYISWSRQRDEETLADASISIAFSVPEGEGFNDSKEVALSTIIQEFQNSFPNITISISAYSQAEYEAAILRSITDENLPTLFDTTGLGADILERVIDLSGVVNRLDVNEIHFLDEYSTYFPDRKQLPIGFHAPVIYLNTTLSDFTGTGLRNFGDLLWATSSAEVAFAIDNADIDAFARTFDSTITETNDNARELFLTGRAAAFFSNSSTFFDVQMALPARYRLVYADTDTPAAQFTDLWSISQYASNNERIAAERFLRYMLSDSAQDIFHIRNRSGNLPINKNVLELFSEIYIDFYGFFDNISSYTFQ